MPKLESWHPIPATSAFSLLNLPFGIISTASNPSPRPAIALGGHALDLAAFTAGRGFSALPAGSPPLPHATLTHTFTQPSLNAFASLGRPTHRLIRGYIQSLFLASTPHPQVLRDNVGLREICLIPLSDVTMHLPMQIGDYTDFYAGKYHAVNCGRIFRGEGKELGENYVHMPIGYHGRASSIVVSGTPVRRPRGQVRDDSGNGTGSVFSQSRKLDFELELGAFVCKENKMGEGRGISVDQADGEGIFGVVLLNDWSARDIQMWETVPLGPFNGKNFGTSVSAWVVLWDALEPFRVEGLGGAGDGELLPYLREERRENVFDIRLEVDVKPESKPTSTILRSNGRNLLFSFPQMLAHHSVGGCPMRVGDLLGSGTISGPDEGSEGSLLEASKNGKVSIKLDGGEERTFLEDGDTVILRGVCGTEEEGLVGFGDCVGQILPAIDMK